MADPVTIHPAQSALVLIDLQKGVLGLSVAPHATATVVANARTLATAFRAQGGLVVFVHVGSSAGGKDMLDVPTDASLGGGERPDDWMDFSDELKPEAQDLVVTKRQWGAFYGTDLDLQLRRRKIGTLVMGGIATNYGVESTARDAYERSYSQVFVEDAMAGMTEEAHRFAIDHVLKRIGRVRSTEAVVEALK